MKVMSVFSIQSLRQAFVNLDKDDKRSKKAKKNVRKYVSLLHTMICLTDTAQSHYEFAFSTLAQDVYHSNLLVLFINNISLIDFECRNKMTQVFRTIISRKIGTRAPTVEYVCTEPQILFKLIKGYENYDIALNCGLMLRECAKFEPLAKIILQSDDYYKFFDYVQSFMFDICTDAFSSFKAILISHNDLCKSFLNNNHKFFDYYQTLIQSDNYVTKRLSFKLLAKLFDNNMTILADYMINIENLSLLIRILNDCIKYPKLQFQVFQVCKLFVTNLPNMSDSVRHSIIQYRHQFVSFLNVIQTNGNRFPNDNRIIYDTQHLIDILINLN
jgi:calcium binding protein 39